MEEDAFILIGIFGFALAVVGLIFAISGNSGDQDLSTYIEGNMSAETITTITTLNGSALSFDGSNDYVSITNTALKFNSGSQDFTLSAWIYPRSGVAPRILSFKDADNDGWRLLIVNNVLWCSVDTIDVKASTSVILNAWQHVVCVIDRDGDGQIYSDGITNGVPVAIRGEAMSIKTNTLRIGGDPTNTYFFNGSIDEVLIFNRSLNSTEVEQLYNSGVGLYANTSIAPFNDGLVAGWHFDEGTGKKAIDITGKNNGTLINGPTWVTGKVAHNESSTVLGEIGLMPYVTANNFISTDYALKWDGSLLLNIWNTISTLGNSTNRWNIFAWDTETVNLNVTNQTTMNNLTVNNLNVINSFTGNCVNASILNGIIGGCNDI